LDQRFGMSVSHWDEKQFLMKCCTALVILHSAVILYIEDLLNHVIYSLYSDVVT